MKRALKGVYFDLELPPRQLLKTNHDDCGIDIVSYLGAKAYQALSLADLPNGVEPWQEGDEMDSLPYDCIWFGNVLIMNMQLTLP